MNETTHAKTAQGLASMGRYGDSMLVHMNPKEVAGLQALAMAHGGSLTINPETGLPEAFLLAPLFGAALGGLTGMSALGVGLTTGLLGWAITGDLGKGILAGLGGAGGAGLAGALGNFGAASQAATPLVTPVGASAAGTAAAASAPALTGAASLPASFAPQAVAGAIPTVGATTGALPSIGAANTALLGGTNLTNAATLGGAASGLSGAANTAALASSVPVAGVPNISAGLSKAFADPVAFAKAYPMETLTAASPLISSALQPPQYQFPTAKEEETPYEGPYYPTERTASFPTEQERAEQGTKEYQYFTPIHPYPGFEPYNPNYKGYAEGGDVYETPDPGSDPLQDARDANEYGLGGLASFAAGGSTGEQDYGLSTATGSYTDPNSIPSAAFQAQLNKYDKDLKNLMTPRFQGIAWGQGPMGTNIPYQVLADRNRLSGYDSSPWSHFGMFTPNSFFTPRLSRAQAEARLGPRPVWTPPPQVESAASTYQANPGFQGAGITSLPTTPMTAPSPKLTADFSNMASGIVGGMGGFGMAKGGFLDGPGDGMSDSIPATIAGKQPARLADGEFVVPADVVSHLGNGSTKAGAKRLYAMMDKVRQARTGTTKQGKQIKPEKYMPS